MVIKKLINELLDSCINECKRECNRQRIENDVLEPMIDFIIEKIKPYIFGMSIFLVTIVLLIISILCLIIFR